MMLLKTFLFILIIITIKFIFMYVIDIGDIKIRKMKELIDFTDYLKLYSCDMKMPFEEILLKYDFKSEDVKKICYEMFNNLKTYFFENETEHEKKDLNETIKELIMTPRDFNYIFTEIIDYYGNSYSDVLDKKMDMTIREMQKKLYEFELSHKEKKNLYNRISLLVGCLTAVILI